MVRQYNWAGLSIERCLQLVGMSKNQYYHRSTGKQVGRRPSQTTAWQCPHSEEKQDVCNTTVVNRIVELKLDPDRANYYKLICIALCLEGYFINHKKVYRLMKEYVLLEERSKTSGKQYVQYRRVVPKQPLEIIEMDIKYVWLGGRRKYAYILTIIDTYTRYVLHWDVGYRMKTAQVKKAWEYVIAHYIQKYRGKDAQVEIEVRSDNGKQFSSKEMIDFFDSNDLTKVFTHPYTPEENGHIESFHKTLGKALKHDHFETLEDLYQRLARFYVKYNNERSHGSIKGLPPSIFWALDDQELIEYTINEDKRTMKFKLKVAYQEILGLPDIKKHQYRVNRA